MAEFYVEQQGWVRWPKVLIMCRKNGRDVTRRRYVPEVERGEGMSITDELREWANFKAQNFDAERELFTIAARIDAEHERTEQDLIDANNQMERLCECSIELPVDADGEYIHIGDVMDSRVDYLFDGKPFTVRALVLCEDGWAAADGRFGNRYEPDSLRHHHAPAVEDVLREFAVRVAGDDECMTMRTDVIAEYASKLRLREDA